MNYYCILLVLRYRMHWYYKNGMDSAELIPPAAPEGIDVYFDNVGGEMTDVVQTRMNTNGRISVCGQIAIYNDRTQDTGPRPLRTRNAREIWPTISGRFSFTTAKRC